VSEEKKNMKRDGVSVLGVGSTDQARQILKDNGISPLDSGVVPGITGALLNEGE
jgi:predicted ATP-grasp superfamily ATP-dependent carboligase